MCREARTHNRDASKPMLDVTFNKNIENVRLRKTNQFNGRVYIYIYVWYINQMSTDRGLYNPLLFGVHWFPYMIDESAGFICEVTD